MIGKKALLGAVLGRSGIASACLRASGPRRGELTILAYHRVMDMGAEHLFPQDPELVSASVADFERQVHFVRDHFTVLRLSDVADCIEQERPLPKRSLVITFDDGHLDNYTHAFPVLRNAGVPACIFLSTDYIGTPRMFWFDRVALLLYSAPAGHWQFAGLSFRLPQGDVEARRSATKIFLRQLKQVSNAERLACIEALEWALAPHVQPQAVPDRSAMNWDEVREMARGGIEFGSHTCSHPILSRLDDASLQHELAESRRIIERETGQAAHTIAYPVGKADAFDERVMAMSRQSGYRLGISYEIGVNPLDTSTRYALRRLAIERYTAFPFFKSMLAFPALLA